MASDKHYPPAYYRFREKHKTITVYVDNELKEKIDKMKGQKSYAQLIKEILTSPSYEKAFSDGYSKGYSDTKEKYGISVPCTICGKPIFATKGDEMYLHVVNFLKKEGWHHQHHDV